MAGPVFPVLNLIIATVYRPPTCQQRPFLEIIERIKVNLTGMGPPSHSVVLCGDFNLPIIINWFAPEMYGGSAA